MISDILKTKCPVCSGAIYPEYFKDSNSRTCPRCDNTFPITLKAVVKARVFALLCFFVFPVIAYVVIRERVIWPLLLCILAGVLGYGKLTNYRASMPHNKSLNEDAQ